MNQCLKISIARGGCRFATPLYLGSSYVLSFEGARSDEAKKVLFVKPRSLNPDDTDGIEGLAESFVGIDGITISLDRKALVEWFKSNRACDVDSYVDAHCYVFNEKGEVLADSPVSIEYKPIDFIIDPAEFSTYSSLLSRVVTLEEKRVGDRAKIDANEEGIAGLKTADNEIRKQTASDIAESAKNTLISAKAYADLLRQMVARIEYIRDIDASTEELDRYRKIEVGTKTVDGKQEIILHISEELYTLDGGIAGENRYVYNDTSNIFGGDGTTNTFNTAVVLNGVTTLAVTPPTDDNSKKVVNSEWVNANWVAHKNAFLAAANTWAGKQTFSGGIDGDLTGDVVGNVDGDVTGSVEIPENESLLSDGDATFNGEEYHNGLEKHTGNEVHTGMEQHDGAESHNGEVHLENVYAESPTEFAEDNESKKGVNKEYLWEMFKVWGHYLDGYWRIAFHKTQPQNAFKYDGRVIPNTAHTANFTTWKQHANQAGVLLPDTEVLDVDAFYSAGGLIKIHAPNLKELRGFALFTCGELLEAYMPKLETVGEYALAGLTKLPNNMFNVIAQRVKRIKQGGMITSTLWNYVNLPLLEVGDYLCLQGLRTTVVQISIGTHVPNERLGDPELLRSAITNVWNMYKDTSLENGNLDASVLTAMLEEEYPNLKEDFTFCEPRFDTCASLTSVSMPNTQIIGDGCFIGCANLLSIDIRNAVFIGSKAFAGTAYNTFTGKSIGLLDIPKCLFVGNGAFKSLSGSYYTLAPDWIKADECEYVGESAFFMGRYLKGFYAPKLKGIGKNAFKSCLELDGTYYEQDGVVVGGTKGVIHLPECKRLGEGCFGGCAFIKTVNIPKCTEVFIGAFTGTTALADVYLYEYDYNKLMTDITTWGLATTAYTREPDGSHTGVAIHATYTDGRKCVVAYTASAWRFQHYED